MACVTEWCGPTLRVVMGHGTWAAGAEPGIEHRGGGTKKSTFMCTWEERRTKGEDEKIYFYVDLGRTKNKRGRQRQHAWQLGVGRRQLPVATGGDAASEVSVLSPLHARIVLLSCCVRCCESRERAMCSRREAKQPRRRRGTLRTEQNYRIQLVVSSASS